MPYYTSTGILGETVIILTNEDLVTSFTENPQNTDYQEYLAWLAEGNTPQPWPPAA